MPRRSLTNFGEPFIFVEDANHENRGELLLHHRQEGVDLDPEHARATLAALYRVWRRQATLLTAARPLPRRTVPRCWMGLSWLLGQEDVACITKRPGMP